MLYCYCPSVRDWVPGWHCEETSCEMCDESVRHWVEIEEVTDER